MKHFFSIALFLITYTASAQMYVDFHYENGKYGFSLDSHLKTDKNFLIPVEYDTIFEVGMVSSKYFLAAEKEGTLSYFWFDTGDETPSIHLVETLGINYMYRKPDGDWNHTLIATNPKGDQFTFQDQFKKANNSDLTIVRKENDALYLTKNGESINSEGYNNIEIVSSYFVCENELGFWFYDREGKLAMNEAVDDYEIDYHTPDYFRIYKGEKRGHLDLTGTIILPLTDINTPERVWHSDDSDSEWRLAPPTYMAVGELKKMGLIDVKGNELWPRTSKRIIVAFSGSTPAVLKKVKKKWELYSQDLELIKTLDFDEFIGSDDETAIVSYDDRLVTLDVFTGDTSEVDFTQQYENFRLILSADDKVGAINREGELFIPCTFSDIQTYPDFDEIIVLENENGWNAFNVQGESICEAGFDQIWPFEDTENAYVCMRGDLWSLVSLDDKTGFGPTELYDPWMQFNIDVEAHLAVAEFYIFKKDKKCGIMNNKGEVIHEATYDYIFFDLFAKNNMFIGLNKDQFTVFQADMALTKKIDANHFLKFSDEFGFVFSKGDQVFGIDPSNLEEIVYNHIGYQRVNEVAPYNFFYEPRTYGVCDSTGKIIIPIEYERIIPNITGNENPFIKVLDKNGFYALFSESGEKILGFNNHNINNFCRTFNNLLFIINKDGTRKIVTWHADTKSFDTLAEDVLDVKCMAYKKVGYIAEIEFNDHTKKRLYSDLTVK